MTDSRGLAGAEGAAGAQLHHDGGACLLLFPPEHGPVGDVDVHARRLDRRDLADRSRELAFECPPVAHLLLKGSQAQTGVVEDLEADRAGTGQALGRELQAQVVDALERDLDRRPGVCKLERHLASSELLDHLLAMRRDHRQEHGRLELGRPRHEFTCDRRQVLCQAREFEALADRQHRFLERAGDELVHRGRSGVGVLGLDGQGGIGEIGEQVNRQAARR